MSHKAYLSLGSNIGDARENLRVAIEKLEACGEVIAQSRVYATEPVDYKEQAWFINCAVLLLTDKSPQELMSGVLAIEKEMGRRRGASAPKGPRTIDIDIVLFDEDLVELGDLQIPHPRMQLRRFVLAPLAEIAPGVRHPGLDRSVLELLQELGPAGPAALRLEPL